MKIKKKKLTLHYYTSKIKKKLFIDLKTVSDHHVDINFNIIYL